MTLSVAEVKPKTLLAAGCFVFVPDNLSSHACAGNTHCHFTLSLHFGVGIGIGIEKQENDSDTDSDPDQKKRNSISRNDGFQKFTISEFLCSACNTANPAISNALPVTAYHHLAFIFGILFFFVL
jgi:hypothetical protein